MLREAVRLRPSTALPSIRWDRCCLIAGHRRRRWPFLDRAVEVNPLNAATWYSLGAAYFKIGKMAEALEAAKRAVVLNEEDARYQRLVAEIQERLKK